MDGWIDICDCRVAFVTENTAVAFLYQQVKFVFYLGYPVESSQVLFPYREDQDLSLTIVNLNLHFSPVVKCQPDQMGSEATPRPEQVLPSAIYYFSTPEGFLAEHSQSQNPHQTQNLLPESFEGTR